MKSLVLKGSFFSLVERFTVLATTLFLTPFIIRHLGQEDYGLWLLILSLIGWFSILNLGLPQAVSRFIIIAIEEKAPNKINEIYSTAIFLFFILGCIASLSMLAISIFPEFFELDRNRSDIFALSVKFVALKVLIDFLVIPFNGIFSGLLRMDLDAKISTLNMLLKASLMLLLLPKFHIWGILFATIFSDILTQLLKVVVAKRLHPSLAFSSNLIFKRTILALINFGKYILVMHCGKILYKNSPAILLIKLLDLTSLAIYGVAKRLVEQADEILNAAFASFAPMFTKLIAQKKKVEYTFNRITELNLFCGTVLTIVVCGASETFITLWLGDDFIQSAIIVKILAGIFIATSISRSCQQILIAQAHHKLLSAASVLGPCISIISAIFVAPEWGLVGVAICFVSGNAVVNICASLYIFSVRNQISVQPTLFRLAISISLAVGIGYLPNHSDYIPALNWISLVIYTAGLTIVACLASWFFICGAETRHVVLTTLTQFKQART